MCCIFILLIVLPFLCTEVFTFDVLYHIYFSFCHPFAFISTKSLQIQHHKAFPLYMYLFSNRFRVLALRFRCLSYLRFLVCCCLFFVFVYKIYSLFFIIYVNFILCVNKVDIYNCFPNVIYGKIVFSSLNVLGTHL